MLGRNDPRRLSNPDRRFGFGRLGRRRGGGSRNASGGGIGTGGLVLAPPTGNDVGGGTGTGTGGAESTADCGTLKIVVRDFTPEHPDFEKLAFAPPPTPPAEAFTTAEGIVGATLGRDGKPTFASNGALGGRVSLTDATTFGQWYTDAPGVNQRFEVDIKLGAQDGEPLVYDSAAFFPIDGQGFGDYLTWGHNFHFTTETRLEFRYQGGEVFTFRGDDDLWLFIDKKLALDLGGIHAKVEGTVNLDTFATSHGLIKGELYSCLLYTSPSPRD